MISEPSGTNTAIPSLKNWTFDLILLAVYLAVFHIWMWMDRTYIVGSGIIVVVILLIAVHRFNADGYFINRWELSWRFLVILDILLETVLPVDHDHYGFYFCALAFALFIGWYRVKMLRVQLDSTRSP